MFHEMTRFNFSPKLLAHCDRKIKANAYYCSENQLPRKRKMRLNWSADRFLLNFQSGRKVCENEISERGFEHERSEKIGSDDFENVRGSSGLSSGNSLIRQELVVHFRVSSRCHL